MNLRARQAGPPAPVVGIRVESGGGARIVLGTVATGLLACVAVLIVFRDGPLGSHSAISRAQISLPFTAQDDYDSIVSRLGPPAEDCWKLASGVRYRRLSYPQKSLTLFLVEGSYAGARDGGGRVIHAVQPMKNLR